MEEQGFQAEVTSEKPGDSKPPKKINNYRGGKGKGKYQGKQGKKDSESKRVNFDNMRLSDVAKLISRDSKKGGANSISELNKNPGLLKAAASVPFATILGDVIKGYAVPGIMTIVWEPAFGMEHDEFTVWNKAAQQVYSYIVHANSRNYKYNFTDLNLFMLAGMEVFDAIHEAARAYGIVKYYPEQNRYLADGLLTAMGWDPNDLRQNLGQIWFDINNLIMQTKQIWVPDIFPILERHSRYNTNVYTDAQGDRSQMYVYVRNKYYMLSETADNNGTCLLPALIKSNNDKYVVFERQTAQTVYGTKTPQQVFNSYKWAQFRDMIQSMINALVASEDRGMIYGDLLNAYTSSKIYAMPEINASFTVTPQYNAEVLMQIENLTTVPLFRIAGLFQTQDGLDYGAGPHLYQAYNYLTSTFADIKHSPGPGELQILNMHFAGQPTPEAIMVASRMKPGPIKNIGHELTAVEGYFTFNATTGKYNNDIAGQMKQLENLELPTVHGSEVPIGMWIFKYESGWIQSQHNYSMEMVAQYISQMTQSGIQGSPMVSLTNIQAFDWHPFFYTQIVYAENVPDDTEVWSYVESYGDFDNYTTLDEQMLLKMHQVAFYSLYGVPQI